MLVLVGLLRNSSAFVATSGAYRAMEHICSVLLHVRTVAADKNISVLHFLCYRSVIRHSDQEAFHCANENGYHINGLSVPLM